MIHVPKKNPTITKSLTPVATEGLVVVVNPPAPPMDMTADAAEISAIRLLEAAAKVR